MLEKTLNRIMLGAKTPEGKIIAILLTISLSLMTWNAASISYAFAADNSSGSAASVSTQSEKKTEQKSEEKKSWI